MVLIALGMIIAAAIYIICRKREKRIKKPAGPVTLLNPDNEKTKNPEETAPSETAGDSASALPPVRAPSFSILQGRRLLLADLLRVVLLLTGLLVAAGLVLILLPQSSIDDLARRLQARHGASQPEKIAFLYLGDELKDSQFQIRGVIRNITVDPIEQADAVIRIYSYDRSLLETTVVRLSKEIIGPGEIAQFALVYPNYKQEFGSYSVEFKLRQGGVLPYKDMRATRTAKD